MVAPATGDPRVRGMRGLVARFVAAGVDVNDCLVIFERAQRWDDWCTAWCEAGDHREQLGREALGVGRTVSAAEHLAAAAAYYHFGKFLFLHDRDQYDEALRRSAQAYRDAAPLLSPPAERVEVPCQGASLPGYLRRPEGPPAPVAILVGGLDATKEELHVFSDIFLRRGLATLCFDGPGQGESAAALPIRPDYEVGISAALDVLAARADVRGDRVGVAGVSLGGYYAARGAAFDERVAALASVSGPFDWGSCWDQLPPLSRQHLRLSAGLANEEEARAFGARFTLEGVAQGIRCPVLVIQSQRDARLPEEEKTRLVRDVGEGCQLVMYENGDHVCHNISYRYRPLVADWVADALRPS